MVGSALKQGDPGALAALDAWLKRLEQRAGPAIELGLERVAQVYQALALDFSELPVITVAGTNGKGSVVAYLETLYRVAGYRTFAYTSPHLLAFAERIRFDGAPAGAAEIVAAFEQIETARGDTRLTYFEHTTLAALSLAAAARPEVMILEVGLGGRLDAVNMVDADVAVISSIGLDHLDWLGPDRDAVAREKCGIARPGRPLVIGDAEPPPALAARAAEIGARCWWAGRDFRWFPDGGDWQLQFSDRAESWPVPAMGDGHQLANAACARIAAECLHARLPFDAEHYHRSLIDTRLPGRFQSFGGRPEIVLDVGHNAAAAAALAGRLRARGGGVVVVLGMLADKDAAALAGELSGCVDVWLCVTTGGERGRTGSALAAALARGGVKEGVEALESVAEALDRARLRAAPEDLILVFGSFLVVAEALELLSPAAQVERS